MIRKALSTVVVSAVLSPVLLIGPAARGDVPLDCGGYDQRTPADRLPKPGVVVVHRYQYSPWTYEAETVDSSGHLSYIGPSSHPSDYPLVAAWQNGTNCSGSEISRNTWATAPDGRVFGGAEFSGPPASNFGDMAGKPLNRPIVGMSPTTTGNGYWLVASDGGIFSFGDAIFHGSTGNIALNQPIVGMAATPTGAGYWMVATDGGIFSFGDAVFHGSTGNLKLNRPVEAMLATPSGKGYWMVADDGGIFTFGDATFHGSTGGQNLSAPIAGMVPNGSGYTLIGQDGQLYPFA